MAVVQVRPRTTHSGHHELMTHTPGYSRVTCDPARHLRKTRKPAHVAVSERRHA
jgi:hypothetical protein